MILWYEAKPKAFDLPNDGEPIAYFSDPLHASKYARKLWQNLAEVNTIENPSHLEFILKKDKKEIASFKYKLHAIKYNHENFNGKCEVKPNPQ